MIKLNEEKVKDKEFVVEVFTEGFKEYMQRYSKDFITNKAEEIQEELKVAEKFLQLRDERIRDEKEEIIFQLIRQRLFKQPIKLEQYKKCPLKKENNICCGIKHCNGEEDCKDYKELAKFRITQIAMAKKDHQICKSI